MGKLRKIGKKIVKGIKTGLKSIGKAFKSAFKGIGKFIGKLGPIGMLGMMLLMPQMVSWWSSFGQWAGTLGKGFGTVMRGIHKAGTMLGKAYSTVTETIGKTLNVATGGTFSTAGTLGYEAGYSDQLANWMSSKMDVAREGLGLETAGGVVPSASTGDTSVVGEGAGATGEQFNRQLPEGLERANIYEGLPSADQAAANLQDSLSFDASMTGEQVAATSFDSSFKPQTIEPYSEIKMSMNKPVYDPKTGVISGGEATYEFAPTGKGTTVPSTWDKVKKYGVAAYGGATVVRDELKGWGLLDEQGGSGYAGLGPAEAAVDTQIQAQDDWAAMGMGGQLPWGNTIALFNSIYGQA